jgi:hypothetical protein
MAGKEDKAQKKTSGSILGQQSEPSNEAAPNQQPNTNGEVAVPPNPTIKEQPKSDITKETPVKFWLDAIDGGNQDEIKASIAEEIRRILKKHGIENYLTLMLFDPDMSIADTDLNRLYEAASANEKKKNILLILHSNGGNIEPAYLISKALKALSKEHFAVAVPRLAKSAATLICLGADEIHMGLTSQLGPIDPQIDGLPSLGLANALDTLADLACRFPAASEMLSGYLRTQLDLRVLGYFNRVAESAVQYGERLLAEKELAKNETARSIADRLVNHYKDHGFVIDIDEAKLLLVYAVRGSWTE